MMTVRWLREKMRMGKSIYDLPLRVTFYARVSTEKVEQQGSLETKSNTTQSLFRKSQLDVYPRIHRRGHFRHQHLQAGQLPADDRRRPAGDV